MSLTKRAGVVETPKGSGIGSGIDSGNGAGKIFENPKVSSSLSKQSIIEPLGTWKAWALVLLIAMGPFLLRTGLNLESVQRQAVLQVYRNLRFSPLLRDLPQGSSLIFERQNEKSFLEDAFNVQLQKDFKFVEIGEAPRIRIFMETGTFLHARVEKLGPEKGAQWESWEYSVRFVNNGLLLGMWLGLLAWIFMHRLRLAAGLSIFCMLLWQVDWNLLEVPRYFWDSARELIVEVWIRIQSGNWAATEYGRLVDLAAVVWFVFAAFGYRWFAKRYPARMRLQTLLLSFLTEPFFLWASSKLAQWGGDTSWWKIYLGSMSYRFVLFAHLFLVFLRPGHFRFDHESQVPRLQKESHSWLFYFIPVVFVLCGGWSWIHSVFAVGNSLSLLRLKLFFA